MLPRETPEIVEFTKALFGMLVRVLEDPLIDTPFKVLRVFPNDTELDPIVIELLVSAELGILLKVFVDPLIDLLVRIWLPVKVTTEESIAIVTAALPL